MPKFITIKDLSFQCGCTNCIEENLTFESFDELQAHLKQFKIVWFECPISGCSCKLPTITDVITEHIKNNHKTISKSMGLDDKTKHKTAIYCRDCEKYSTFQHFHCYECESKKFFKSKLERDEHLKSEHTKWWLEKPCKHGVKCEGFQNGECGFNHNNNSETFVSDETNISPMICYLDKPWEKNSRCKKDKCPFDHFWGHVRHIIKKNIASKKKIMKDTDFCTDCTDDGDRLSKVVLCAKCADL